MSVFKIAKSPKSVVKILNEIFWLLRLVPQKRPFVPLIVQNLVEHFVFLKSPIVFKDFCRVVEEEEPLLHVVVLAFLNFIDRADSVLPKSLVDLRELSLGDLADIQKWPPFPRHALCFGEL